ncbi:hypothetical protein K503DRAFT_698326 [Rhizopogon vinicolor AM-OR11-026]|uniref:Uncharacterized protein n=1 Tax=Rhizopogon vinicolor AM-OR11-026 TaxID=1314800 RepID=A0A1B7MPW5_9AGAM|nr:hypothetical protein K503DRAFT_698326 [Rhizopogon vinicolor AM-OR11-026]
MSSILAHYSALLRKSPSARVALTFSHLLRRTGKLLAIINSIWLVTLCIFQYSSFYDTCFCKSSVIGRGKAAYSVIIESTAQATQVKAAWAGTLVLASTSALIFLGIVNLLLDTLPS